MGADLLPDPSPVGAQRPLRHPRNVQAASVVRPSAVLPRYRRLPSVLPVPRSPDLSQPSDVPRLPVPPRSVRPADLCHVRSVQLRYPRLPRDLLALARAEPPASLAARNAVLRLPRRPKDLPAVQCPARRDERPRCLKRQREAPAPASLPARLAPDPARSAELKRQKRPRDPLRVPLRARNVGLPEYRRRPNVHPANLGQRSVVRQNAELRRPRRRNVHPRDQFPARRSVRRRCRKLLKPHPLPARANLAARANLVLRNAEPRLPEQRKDLPLDQSRARSVVPLRCPKLPRYLQAPASLALSPPNVEPRLPVLLRRNRRREAAARA